MRENEEAFRRARIVPRMLRDVSERDLAVELAGTAMPAPLGLAPIGVQSIVHPDGELAVARAAAAVGLPMAVSTVSSFTLEEIAAAAPGPKWFQLYWPRDPELATSFVERAELAGYKAIVVTLDTFLPGWKTRDLQRAWQPFLEGVGIANYLADPVFGALLEKPPEEDRQAAIGQFVYQFSNPGLKWSDLEHLRAATELPILLKGILHPKDAAGGARGRGRRRRRLQPRRPPGRRRDRQPRRAAGDQGRGRRRAHGPARQRHPLRRRRLQGDRARRRRGPDRPPLPVGAGAGGEAGVLAVLRGDARRARPDDRAQRPAHGRRDRPRGAQPRAGLSRHGRARTAAPPGSTARRSRRRCRSRR